MLCFSETISLESFLIQVYMEFEEERKLLADCENIIPINTLF